METGVELAADDEAAVGDEMVACGEVVGGDELEVETVLSAFGVGVEAAAMKVREGGKGYVVGMEVEVVAVPRDVVDLEEGGVNKKVEEVCGHREPRSGSGSGLVKTIASIRQDWQFNIVIFLGLALMDVLTFRHVERVQIPQQLFITEHSPPFPHFSVSRPPSGCSLNMD